MTSILQISEAIKNGIKHLEEERIFGAGTELHQANRKQRIALLRGNEHAAQLLGRNCSHLPHSGTDNTPDRNHHLRIRRLNKEHNHDRAKDHH